MWNKIRLNKGSLRDSVIYIIIIIVLFLLSGYIILNLVNITVFNRMKEDANIHANTHISRLTNSSYANNIINDLLEDRIVSACNIILEHEGDLSDEFLEKTSKNLKVDHIYWYDNKGRIIYTANDFLGWQATPKDPIYSFMMEDSKVLIEPIRKAADSGIYTKYGQIKGETGFVQVGILAEYIKDLTSRFCPQAFMDELTEQSNIFHAYYLNTDNEIIFCDKGTSTLDHILDEEEELAIENDEIYYARKIHHGRSIYEALYPIYIDNQKMGTLIIIYSLKAINKLIKNISYVVLTFLTITFTIYGIMVMNTGRKNRIIKNLAYYDPVTGLFNKNYFMKYMEDSFRMEEKNKKAILIINCKDLGLLRLNYGQESLNDLLKYKVNRLKDLDIVGEELFRYDEERLCLYIEDYKNKERLIEISKILLDSLNKKEDIAEHEKILSFNIAILELNKDYKELTQVLKDIDIIIERFQDNHEEGYTFFDKKDKEEILLNEKIKEALIKAYYNGYEEFFLLYQPQLDLKTNKVIGVEALARWSSKELGNVSPVKFINIAEKSNSINTLGKWIIYTGCKFIKRLESEGINDIKVAINISVIQLLQEGFVDEILGIISNMNINPNLLKIEITETNLMDNYKMVNSKLKELRGYGIRISLDDFGTGHSSLSRLKNLNIDYLKIDKSFVDHIVNLDEDILINSILSLAKELNLKVIAEGVEEEIQREYLKDKGCDIIQGYLFSRPIEEHKAISLIKNINKGEGS